MPKNTFERAILSVLLVMIAIYFVLKLAKVEGVNIAYLGVATLALLMALTLYYLVVTHISIYSIILFLYLIVITGAIFKILHLAGADLLIMPVFFVHFLTAVALIRTGVDMRKSLRDQVFYNYLIAILLLVIIVLPIISNSNFYHAFNYGLLALIVTMKIQKIVLKKEEDRILNLVALESLLVIVSDTLATVSGSL